MELIYRIEDARGNGMCYEDKYKSLCQHYRTSGCKIGGRKGHDFCPGFSIPGELRKIDHEGWHFAFTSIEQITEWYPDEKGRAVMKAKGGHIQVYNVPSFIADDRQCIYDPKEQVYLKTLDLVDFTDAPPYQADPNAKEEARPNGLGLNIMDLDLEALFQGAEDEDEDDIADDD